MRPGCRFCGAPLQFSFADLGKSPLSNAFLRADQLGAPEVFYPLHAYVCEKCFLVQLEEFEHPSAIFDDYAYFSSYSESWLKHAEHFVENITNRLQLNGSSHVVELASNDGYLLQYFVQREIPVLGIEPAGNVAQAAIDRGVPTLSSFFGSALAQDLCKEKKQANLLIANNVLAHVPDLNDFVRGMKLLLSAGGTLTVEVPHLMVLIEQNQFDTIYHEHFSYFSALTLNEILEHHQLAIYDIEELASHGGSLRIYAKHSEDASKSRAPSVSRLLERERAARLDTLEPYSSFPGKIAAAKRSLLQFLISAKDSGKSVAAYGAPAKGNTLLNYCGVRTDLVDYTVDRSPHKQGRFLPGTHIPVYTPEKIRETKPDYLLILPWNLQKEIRSQMAHIHEWGGQFVIPIPQVQVMS